jgi:PIN domain nuclease of toxin-antitoxin system
MQVEKLHIKSWRCANDVFNTIENEYNITIKYIKKEHLLTFANLELLKDHGDPFDRMIIAHAITEKIPLISSDRKMQSYKKQGLDFIFNEK